MSHCNIESAVKAKHRLNTGHLKEKTFFFKRKNLEKLFFPALILLFSTLISLKIVALENSLSTCLSFEIYMHA